MRRVYAVLFLSLLGFGEPFLVFAIDASSTNFQNNSSGFVPAAFNQSSANFQVSASVEDTASFGTSPSFTLRSGVPLSDTSAPPAAPSPAATPPVVSGGGGGALGAVPPPNSLATGGIIVKPPTLSYRSPTFSSHQLIQGTFDPTVSTILVNGSSVGVELKPGFLWQFDLPLFFGINRIVIRSQNTAGNLSHAIGGDIERMLIGDVNRSRHVDDVDLSLFTRAWKKYNFFADFTEDQKINDEDLGHLFAFWNQRY